MDKRGKGVEVFRVEGEDDDAGEEDQGGIAESEGKGERHGWDGRCFDGRILPGREFAKWMLFWLS